MKKSFSTLLCGLMFAATLFAGEPKPPVIIGIEHALSEKMQSPQAKKSRLSLFQRNRAQFAPASEAYYLGDGISLISDRNDLTGALLEVSVAPHHWAELTSNVFFISRLKEITKLIYSKLNDDFDFIFYVLNTPVVDDVKSQLGFLGLNSRVSNNVQGLGVGRHDLSAEWGSEGKLLSAMYFPYYDGLSAGPSLHEILHSWPAFICPTYDIGNRQYLAHWGISNADGQLGGFKHVRVVEENSGGVEGKTLYQASRDPKTNRDGSFKNGGFGVNANDGNGVPYSDIELYLMGLKSAQELREANFQLDVYSGNDYQPETFANGYFTSTGKKSYTIDNIIARNGKRIPDAADSQKQFKALTVVLTPEAATSCFRNDILRDINWLSGEMKDATYPHLYNFRQATGDRGSLIVNNLISSLKNPIIKTLSEKTPEDESSDVSTTYETLVVELQKIADGTEISLPDAFVYPNPTSGKLTLLYEMLTESYIVTLSDARGNVLLRRAATEPTLQLDLVEQPAGLYFLTIEDGLQKITKKIIKE